MPQIRAPSPNKINLTARTPNKANTLSKLLTGKTQPKARARITVAVTVTASVADQLTGSTLKSRIETKRRARTNQTDLVVTTTDGYFISAQAAALGSKQCEVSW
jgi:hypothetical protein